ncbi:MAG: VacJ family lipoprotein [Pseudomonadota bacterium]
MPRLAACLGLFIFVSACAAPPAPGGDYDPLEPLNRTVHTFNTGLDAVALRPASQAYGTVVPEPVRQGVNNFAENAGLPAAILNKTLQGKFEDAAINTGRFLVNTTLGLGGILDPATSLGAPEEDTDFGETLHVWGVGEGAYLALPVLGPSTSRDAMGEVVDFFINPLSAVISTPESNYVTSARVARIVDRRYRFLGTVDSILYESADGYSQTKLAYLQNRRFELGQGSGAAIGPEDPLFDDPLADAPLEDTEGDLYDDLYLD